jgi:serine/threonine-protein kinase
MPLTQRMDPGLVPDDEQAESMTRRVERDTLTGLRPDVERIAPELSANDDAATLVAVDKTTIVVADKKTLVLASKTTVVVADKEDTNEDAATTRLDPNELRARRCPTCAQVFSKHARFCPFDGDPLLDAPDWSPINDPLLGQTVDGRYKVMAVIGEGGMGTVYEVRHTTLDRRFALKVLRRDVAQDPELTARFIQEAKAAASIGHPNIIAVSDFGELAVDTAAGSRAKAHYFVMEFLTGVTLAALLKAERTLTPKRAASILIQCASALEAAHDAGVFHRDLKPDNIFLSEGSSEFVKLLDFGVAKIAGTGRLTRAGMVFGTPHYMSPEQAAGETVDHRADIYALGVIMYECFAGRVPFEADTYMGVLTQHMFVAPVPLERVAPDPRGLGALAPVVMRCLSKKPDSRYANMGEVVQAIQQALSNPSRSSIASAPPSSLRLRDANIVNGGRISFPPAETGEPRRLVVAVAVTALAIGAATTGWWMLRTPSPERVTTAGAESEPARVAAEPGGARAKTPGPSGGPAELSAGRPAGNATSTSAPEASTKPVEPPTLRPSGAPPTPPAKQPIKPRRKGSGEVVDPWDN